MPSGGRVLVFGDKCKDCGTELTPENGIFKGKYLQVRCKSCWSVNQASIPSRTKEARQAYWVQWKFGMSIEEYEALKELQENVCAICKRPEVTGRELSVDHNHDTGALRGLLCYKCNTVLGHIDEDEDILIAMIYYLREHKIK